MTRDLCAKCLKELEPFIDGSTVRCCDGNYLSLNQPSFADRQVASQLGILPRQVEYNGNSYWLYRPNKKGKP